MNLINNTFFKVGPTCFIPQVSQLTISEKLMVFINRYEPEFLRILLGTTLYAAFKSGIEALAPEQRWIDLRDGKTYTDGNGNVLVWEGLANNITKISPIANYVYYWYSRSGASFSTGQGEIAPTAENGTRTNAAGKQAAAWNEMIRFNYACIHFLQAHKELYPEWDGVGWGSGDYEYFFNWWPVYWSDFYAYWWPDNCNKPDIFEPINEFGI